MGAWLATICAWRVASRGYSTPTSRTISQWVEQARGELFAGFAFVADERLDDEFGAEGSETSG